MKKTTHWLLLLAIITSSLSSCIHEETSSASEASILSKEYTSKSLWKEDEKYIKNVKKIFETYSDPNYVKIKHGEVAWNYATTAGDESFLEVPVLKDGKINFTLVVKREGDRVFFKMDPNEKSKKFFDLLVFKNRENLSGTFKENSGNAQSKNSCVTIYKTVTWTDTVSGAILQVDHFVEMHCSPAGPYLECMDMSPDSQCGGGSGGDSGGGGGGSGGGGYSYPVDNQYTDFIKNCTTLKEQAQNTNFQQKVANIDKPEMFKMQKETGYAAAYGPQTSYEQLQNTPNGNVKLPIGNKYFGYIHNHLDLEGIVKIFSPYDISTFLTSCVPNAIQKGDVSQAYAMVITSEGNYILKYTGNGSIGLTQDKIDNWNEWYIREYSELEETKKLTQPNVEKIFAKFLLEIVNINGLEIYKTEKTTGAAAQLTLNSDKSAVVTQSCP